MNYVRLIFLGLILFLSACSAPFLFDEEEAEPRVAPAFSTITVPPNFVPQVILITAIGDSLSQGVGDVENKGGYVGRLAEEIESWPGVQATAIENTAKRGRRSDQLLAMIQSGEVTGPVAQAEFVTMTIGGNDIMRIVKRDLFSLNKEAFYEELVLFENKYRTIIAQLRTLNPDVPIVMLGVYNPFSLITDEVEEFEEIVGAYNAAIEGIAEEDSNSCFVPIADLFHSNDNLVYHTDFFHPNAKGYDLMTERIMERMNECGLAHQE